MRPLPPCTRTHLVLAALLAPAPAAPGITRLWTNPAGGGWSDPTNWAANTIPAAGDTARFNLASATPGLDPYTVTLPDNLGPTTFPIIVQDDRVNLTHSPSSSARLTIEASATAATRRAELTLAGGTFTVPLVNLAPSAGPASLTLAPNTILSNLQLVSGPGPATINVASPNARLDVYDASLPHSGGSTTIHASGPGASVQFGRLRLAGTSGPSQAATALLNLSDGVTSSVSVLQVGSSNGVGTVNLDGASTTLLTDLFTLNHGALSVDHAATVTASGGLYIGDRGLHASVTVANQSSIVSPHSIQLGVNSKALNGAPAARASIDVRSGSIVSTPRLYVGYSYVGPVAPHHQPGHVTVSSDTPEPSTLSVTDIISINYGSLTVSANGRVVTPALYVSSDASLLLDGGSVAVVNGLLSLRDGAVLAGHGSIRATTITPHPSVPNTPFTLAPHGILSLDADVVLSPTSTLLIHIASPTSHDRLTSVRSLTFDGALRVSLSPAVTPAPGDIFDLFDFATPSPGSAFSALDLPPLPPTLSWDTSNLYTTGKIAVVTPEPSTSLFAAFGLAVFSLTRRKKF